MLDALLDVPQVVTVKAGRRYASPSITADAFIIAFFLASSEADDVGGTVDFIFLALFCLLAGLLTAVATLKVAALRGLRSVFALRGISLKE